jgi:ribosomal protein S18 acetylase RimI-like enzyme
MSAGNLARADAFAKRQLERTSTDVEPFDGGTAFLDRDFPLRYDSNLLWIDDPGDAPVDRWLGEADRILGGRGYRHRKVVVPDPDAQRRLEVGFAENGYGIDRVRLMVHRGEPELVGSCELHIDGVEAEVDSVDTLEEHRNHGHASAFVLAAVAAARERGASWVHLWADAADWPQHWYRRLGFRVAADVADFLKWPEDEEPHDEGTLSAAKSPDRA